MAWACLTIVRDIPIATTAWVESTGWAMGGKAKFIYNLAGGALAGIGAGYGIDPSSVALQILLASIFGVGLAVINKRMDNDASFPTTSHTKDGAKRFVSHLNYFAGAGLGKRGALRVMFASLAIVSVFWFARDATEQYAYEWFGYDTQEFVEAKWPIVIGVLCALLGAYRYMANDIEKVEPTPANP